MTIANTPTIAATITDTTLTLTFSNGEVLAVDATTLSADIQTAACLHGLKQKLVDAAAIARNTETGASATLQDKFDAVREVFTRITSPDGTWNKIRAAGEGTANGGQLARALMELTGKTKAQIAEFLEGKSNKEKAALRANPKVAEILARYARATATVDTDSLLDELVG